MDESRLYTEIIPLDPERLEIVKQILKQNQIILDFILEPMPQLYSFDSQIATQRAEELSRYFVGEME